MGVFYSLWCNCSLLVQQLELDVLIKKCFTTIITHVCNSDLSAVLVNVYHNVVLFSDSPARWPMPARIVPTRCNSEQSLGLRVRQVQRNQSDVFHAGSAICVVYQKDYTMCSLSDRLQYV